MKNLLLGVLLAALTALLAGCVVYERYDEGPQYRRPHPHRYRYSGPNPYPYGYYRYGSRFGD